MKKLIKKLRELHEMTEGIVLDREEIFENRSDKWQESEKGEEYQELTERLNDLCNELTDYIEEFENI